MIRSDNAKTKRARVDLAVAMTGSIHEEALAQDGAGSIILASSHEIEPWAFQSDKIT
jgi:hypothetical protein